MIGRDPSIAPLAVLLVATLISGCKSEPERYEQRVSSLAPKGWVVFATNDLIVVQHKELVWTMGTVGRPAMNPGQTVESYFTNFSRGVVFGVQLRFVPKLSPRDIEKLKTERSQAGTALEKGAKSKSEYGSLMRRYADAKAPRFFSRTSSVYVDRRYEPKFTNVYPGEVGTEMERLIDSLTAVFGEYDGMKALGF